MSQVPQQVAGNLCCTVYLCYCVQCSLYTSLKAYINATYTLSVFCEVLTVTCECVLYKKAELIVGIGFLVSLGLK